MSVCGCVCVSVGCMPQRGRGIALIGQLLAPLFVSLFAPSTAASVCSVFQGFQGFQSFSSFSFPSIRTFPSALSVLLIGFVRAPLTALNVPLIELINRGASPPQPPTRKPNGESRNRLTTIDCEFIFFFSLFGILSASS